MTSIAIASASGSRQGVVERVSLGADGCAREMWVRCQGQVRRVPVTAVTVRGSQSIRTVTAADFDAAPLA